MDLRAAPDGGPGEKFSRWFRAYPAWRCGRANPAPTPFSVVTTIPRSLYSGFGPAARQRQRGVSGPVLLPVGVLAVTRVLERTSGMPVIGLGGVRSAADVEQYLRAGATLVGIGTAALADPRLPERIVRDLERRHG